ncbi:MAG: transcriptional repressor [Peptostreptococcaceae bacterium]|nr:transcriptional repressor [Peptostreptococcaceae bacterium]
MAQTLPYKEILIHEGLKNTKHRNSILREMEQNGKPLTADQVYLALVNQNISINLSSVYRVLNTLVEKGLIVKTSMAGENKSLFELNNFDHKHYLVCMKCKNIISVEGCPFAEYENKLKEETGFDIIGHNLEIFGYCPKCKS